MSGQRTKRVTIARLMLGYIIVSSDLRLRLIPEKICIKTEKTECISMAVYVNMPLTLSETRDNTIYIRYSRN